MKYGLVPYYVLDVPMEPSVRMPSQRFRMMVLISCSSILACNEPHRRALPQHSPSTTTERCRELTGDPPAPWPGRAARNTDCGSSKNSDGTSKRSPMAPPGERGRFVLFHYDDFGPGSMAGVLLGSEWWSWEGGGSFERCDEFDVRVVIYDGRAPHAQREAQTRYPTLPRTQDYRHVERSEALRFLDAQIVELTDMMPEPEGYDFGPLKRSLEQTRSVILACLP